MKSQHKTIESVLERGEKLDNLVDRSNALSAQSKMFYKTAKKVISVIWFPLISSEQFTLPAKFLLRHCLTVLLWSPSIMPASIPRHRLTQTTLRSLQLSHTFDMVSDDEVVNCVSLGADLLVHLTT